MNWTETFIGAGAVAGAGWIMAKNAAMKSVEAVSSAPGGGIDMMQAALAQTQMITVVGVSMARADFIAMIVITAVCSAAAAGMTFRDWRSAGVNWALGGLMGWLWALGTALLPQVPDGAIFVLAPSFSLISARLARQVITDDAILASILGAIFRKRK